MQPTGRVVVALERFKGLFLEIPDVRLSVREASKISGLDDDLCRMLLAALVDVRFLTREQDGAYRRRVPLFIDDATPQPEAIGRAD